MLRSILVLIACLSTFLVFSSVAADAATIATIAVPDVAFSDTSGEAGDQHTVHASRTSALTEGLRRGITDAGRLTVLPLACATGCPAGDRDVGQLLQEAKTAGAAYMLVCDVHKMSTLILSMKVGVLDVATGRVVTQRLVSFRGDNDEGWRRAGAFVVKDIVGAMEIPPR